jgi:hypothetical protein
MGWVCSACSRGDTSRFVVRKRERQVTTHGRTGNTFEDNIKMDFKAVVCEIWSVLLWYRIGTTDSCEYYNEFSASIKDGEINYPRNC